MCLSGMNTQLSYIIICLSAVRCQPAIEFSFTSVTVLYADMLVPACSIVEFLWTEWKRCLFMSSNMNLEYSSCTTVCHIYYKQNLYVHLPPDLLVLAVLHVW